MTFTFPAEKEDFTAENGVTYSWTGSHWRVKSYKVDDNKVDELREEFDEKLEDYLPLAGGTLTGKTYINKVREDGNSIAFSIAGRVRNNDGNVIKDVLLKSYQRAEDNTQADYVAYYGSSGGAQEVLNRKAAQDEFASKQESEEGDNVLQGEIDNLKQEIEHLAPSFERGEWDLTTEWPSPGKYGVYKTITYEAAVAQITDDYAACVLACDSDPSCMSDCNRTQVEALDAIKQYDPDEGGSGFIYEPETDWEQVNRVVFAEKDALGISHSFDDVVPGQFMDLYNKDDEGYFIAKVESVSRDPDDEDIIIVAVDAAQWSEIPPNGRALVKFFTIDDGVDVADFVKKTGDKMSGNLHILKGRGPANSSLSTVPFAVCRNAEEGGSAFRVIFNYLKEDGSTEINDVFKINNVGETNVLGNRILNVGDPTAATDGVNRRYVEDKFINKAGEQKLTSDKWNLRAPKVSDPNSYFNYINIRNDEMNLYHVAEAGDDKHAANWGQIKGYAVDKSGDTVRGKIEFNAPRIEEATNSFVIRGALKVDGVIKEGQVIFKDYRDGTGSSHDSSIMYFGRIDGPNHIINKQYLEQYVADNAGEKSDKVIIESGSSVPTLETGRMYLNTTTKMIHVGT